MISIDCRLPQPVDAICSMLSRVAQFQVVMSEAAHSSTYMTRSSEEVMHPSGWALFPTQICSSTVNTCNGALPDQFSALSKHLRIQL